MLNALTVDHNKLWNILNEVGIPEHITCLLRNLYAGQEATIRTGHGTTDWFKIGKGVCKTVASLEAQRIKRLPAMRETRVRSLS